MGRKTLAAALAVALAVIVPGIAHADTGAWVIQGSDHARALDESQGLATVVRPNTSFIQYTGLSTIPIADSVKGWNHVGDPGSRLGYYIEPYQSDNNGAKMFRVQAPDGSWSEYTHKLESWEALNNSFAAVSPDGQWLVSGEWGTMDRLLVYPMPGVRFTTPSQNLPYGFAIRPDHPINNIQGCDFTSPTQLLCSSDDSDGTLYGMTKPLLQLDLSGPLGGSDVTAHVSALGQLPLQSSCTGNFEVEGMDYDMRDGTLRVVVMSPGFCVLTDSKTWRFKHS